MNANTTTRRPLEGPPAEAMAGAQLIGLVGMVCLPDPATLLQQTRRRDWIRAQGLSASEACAIPASYDPGPEFD